MELNFLTQPGTLMLFWGTAIATPQSANLWQSMHNVVMQAGQDKIASLEGTLSTSCFDFLAFVLFVVDES